MSPGICLDSVVSRGGSSAASQPQRARRDSPTSGSAGDPREVDLIPTRHAAVRYGRDEAWIQDFAKHYDYDLRDWAGYQTLLTMRDLAQIPGPLRRAANPPHAAALRQRLDAIRAGDRTATWIAV